MPTDHIQQDVVYVPSENPKRSQRLHLKRHSPQVGSVKHHIRPAKSEKELQAGSRLRDVQNELRKYALQTLAPFSEPDDPDSLEAVKHTVTRVPAVCFNEQKFLDMKDYQVLVQPQSPAIRGQEALARVCHALEQALRLRGTCAAIISDYKFRENYLRRAPEDVLSVLNIPEDEGSHNILMTVPEIGIVCIQVTCVEASTNSGTVKKQVRDTLKQLRKDIKVIKHVLQDLDLDDDCIRMVMALPNVTTDQLKRKLELKSLKMLSSTLNTTDDLEDLLTLDCLPGVGHRHWMSTDSRARLWKWLDRQAGKSGELSIDHYMQMFARYTCGWSALDVWSTAKPRMQIRSWAHAVAETYRRFHLSVLTPQQDELLHSGQSHLLIEASRGTGATCLLKVKAMMELSRDCLVFVFVPQHFTGLRQEYEQLARSVDQYAHNLFFWSDEDISLGSPWKSFKSVCGTFKTLDELKETHEETVALFDYANHDEVLLDMIAEVTGVLSSVWVVLDAAVNCEMMSKEDKFFRVQLETVTRLPSSIHDLIRHAECSDVRDKASTAGDSAPSHQSGSPRRGRQPQPAPDVSSYQGLPTDGPAPLFIWHVAATAPQQESGIFGCHLCMNQLRTALRKLVQELAPKSDAATAVVGKTQRASDSPATVRGVSTATASGVEAANVEKKVEEANIDINSGNVPRPLTAEDVVIFVDSTEDTEAVLKSLDLVNVDKVVHLLTDIPSLLGTEKAVVAFVGSVEVQTADAAFFALFSKLRDAMSLCQGQMILAVDLIVKDETDLPFKGEPGLPIMGKPDLPFKGETEKKRPERSAPHRQIGPFQLDFDDMLRQAWTQHNQ